MEKMKTLRQYAKAKKLPLVKHMGNVDGEWVDYALGICDQSKITTEKTIEGRTVYGTELPEERDDIQYEQKHINDMSLPDTITKMEGVHDLRFAELGGDEFLPLHLDDPWSLRFLVMLEGSHDFIAEEETIPMYSKQVWFINGSYLHGVKNHSNKTRTALLGKWSFNEENIEVLYSDN